MQHEAWFFIGIFVFIFLIWIATGGPAHPISFGGPFLSQPAPLGSGTYIGLPRAPFSIGNSNVVLAGSNSGGGSSSDTYTPPALSGVAFGSPSPYRGQISMSHYVNGAGASDPGSEYIHLSLAPNAYPVTITGWKLASEATGNSAIIPVATEVPVSGIINGGLPLTLQPGQSVYLISGRSPIGGSFRENKCIGYFSQYQHFSPSLPYTCPAPKDELARYYGPGYISDPFCINYVDRLNRCTLSITPPPGATSLCAAFLENYLNYNGCVRAHQSEADFKGTTWWVYLGRTTPLWRTSHEVIKLLDENGKTVDAFTY